MYPVLIIVISRCINGLTYGFMVRSMFGLNWLVDTDSLVDSAVDYV